MEKLQVLCALSFFATGSYQSIVGVARHLAQRTVSRCLRQVVDALYHRTITSRWIKFPRNREERNFIQQKFQREFGLPGVIGCIDCTHAALVKPSELEHQFYNRKGYHSVNVQMVCDSDLRIMNCNPRYGGATHDSFILANSKVDTFLRRLHQSGEQVWLLGDSGYPLRPWIMTPIVNAPQGSREEEYTRIH